MTFDLVLLPLICTFLILIWIHLCTRWILGGQSDLLRELERSKRETHFLVRYLDQRGQSKHWSEALLKEDSESHL